MIPPFLKTLKFLFVILLVVFEQQWTFAQRQSLLQEATEAFYQGEIERARDLARAYARINTGDMEGRILLARSLASTGENEEAFFELSKILEDDPKNIDALFYLASVSTALSQQSWARLYRSGPKSARVRQLMGDSYRAQKEYQKAVQEYEAALEIDPGLVEVRVALGDMVRIQGDCDEAIRYYQQVLEASRDRFEALYGMGVCNGLKGDYATAQKYFRKTIRLAPGYADAHLALGKSLLQSGDAEQAVSQLQEAVRFQPSSSKAYFQLGRAYQVLGQKENSDRAFQEAERLSQGGVNR